MSIKKQKSIIRSKKSTTSFAEILSEYGSESIVPGSSFVIKGAKLLYQHAGMYFADRRELRVEEFFKYVFEGESEENYENIINTKFSPEYYYTLLSHAIQDEEDQKVEFYSKIFKSLQRGDVPDKYRVHILKTSRELTCHDFELMRRVYISSKYEFKSIGSTRDQIKNLTVTNDPIQSYSIQNLVRLGYLFDKDGTKPPYPTELLEILVNAAFLSRELLPEAIGQEVWENVKVFIASFNLSQNEEILLKIDQQLYKTNIKSVLASPQNKSFALSSSKILILCDDLPNNQQILSFLKSDKVKNKHIVILQLPTSPGNTLYDSGMDVFRITSSEDETISKLCNHIKELIG